MWAAAAQARGSASRRPAGAPRPAAGQLPAPLAEPCCAPCSCADTLTSLPRCASADTSSIPERACWFPEIRFWAYSGGAEALDQQQELTQRCWRLQRSAPATRERALARAGPTLRAALSPQQAPGEPGRHAKVSQPSGWPSQACGRPASKLLLPIIELWAQGNSLIGDLVPPTIRSRPYVALATWHGCQIPKKKATEHCLPQSQPLWQLKGGCVRLHGRAVFRAPRASTGTWSGQP